MMKITIMLNSSEEMTLLPIQHNHYIQAALYKLLDPAYAAFLHDQGYTYEKRQFRLFSFSRLIGKYKIFPEQGTITFYGPLKLVVLSPLKPVYTDIVNSLILGKKFRIGKQILEAKEVRVEQPVVSDRKVRVHTLSPIVCYSTLEQSDGKEFTYYYNPAETEFNRLVAANLYKKIKAWEPDQEEDKTDFDFSISPLSNIKMRLVMYKGHIIKGYSGEYLLQGNTDNLNFALNVGLGAKGAQGFGAIEAV